MGAERAFGFGRIDILAARDDHILGTIDNEQITVLIEIASVPAHNPAVL